MLLSKIFSNVHLVLVDTFYREMALITDRHLQYCTLHSVHCQTLPTEYLMSVQSIILVSSLIILI